SLFRALVSSVVVLATYYFVYWLPFSLIPLGGQRWIASVISLLCAVGAGCYVWARTRSGAATWLTSVLYGAIVLVAIGFASGLFGRRILPPEPNQGPLLGIFFTGPLGMVIGPLVVWSTPWPGESHKAIADGLCNCRRGEAALPQACPWTVVQILDDGFWPDI